MFRGIFYPYCNILDGTGEIGFRFGIIFMVHPHKNIYTGVYLSANIGQRKFLKGVSYPEIILCFKSLLRQ